MAAQPDRPSPAAQRDDARRRWLALCVVAGVATALDVVLLAAGVGEEGTVSHLSNVGNLLIALIAAVALLLRARQCVGRLRTSWGLVGLGVLAWAIGQGCWGWYESVQSVPVPAYPSAADYGYLGLTPLTACGLLLLPVAKQALAQRVRSVLDGLMIAVSLLLISWIVVLHPLVELGDGRIPGRLIILAYPISDVVIVTVVLYMLAMLRPTRKDMTPLVLVGLGMVIIAVADSGYAYLNLVSVYSSGSVIDAGWFAGFALMALAAGKPIVDRAEPAGTVRRAAGGQVGILMPYAAVLAALVTSVVQFIRVGADDPFTSYSRSLLILLIVVRQLLTLLETRHLTRDLESRVADRTADLLTREQQFRALVQQSSDSLTVVDAGSTVRYQSDSIVRIFGYQPAQLEGELLTTLLGRRSGARLAAAIAAVIGEPYATTVIELDVRHQDGRRRHAEMTVTNLLDDPNVGGFVLNTRDISDSKELQEQLVHDAYHDGLTELASRALFRERLEAALADGRHAEVVVLFLDLDGFKEVNDSLGHAAGDQLLVQVAGRLLVSVREDDMVARFGGDEFAVLVESIVAVADAETVARRIVDALREPFLLGGRQMHVGGSIGLAAAADAADIDQLMRNADLAMYQAKATGGSGFASYDPRMLSGLVGRLELETDLRLALERDELELHYQPTIDLTDERIVGFEALVRWRHPTRGLVSPLDFIGIAEATGLIVPLGRWVLAEACRQTVEWVAADPDRQLKMAVNVSVRQFEHSDLSAVVAQVLAETGMPVERLCLEMTESVLMTDTEENLAQLRRLKALGVSLAMDDFGTGYSSLAYLGRFPMDVLKIDRSFVDRLGGDSEDTALVQMIVRLGQSLGMATVAEGIEQPEQLAALRELGCGLGQGFYFSRPVPAPEAGRLLREGLPTPLTV